jgi:hypothetical protein
MPRQPKVANLDSSGPADEDIGRFDVAVDQVIVVQVREALEELERSRFNHGERDEGFAGAGVLFDEVLGMAEGCLESFGIRSGP